MFKKIATMFLCLLLVCAVLVNGGAASFNAFAAECEHDFGDWSLIQYPTCTEQGIEYKICEECGYLEEIVFEEALGHKPGAEATCETAQTCTVCNEVLKEALGHDYEITEIPATCTQDGRRVYTCKTDSTHKKTETISALGHTFVNGICSGCNAVLGDANADNELDIRDLIILKESILNNGKYDSLIDVNIDGALNAGDIVALTKILFARM